MYRSFFKRLFDISISIFLILFLSLPFLVLLVLVRIKLGSPTIFKQVRPGKNGTLFLLYKFRSMTNEKDEEGKLLPDEKRLTKFGKFLRKTSLDELPELFNILKGDMSFIGPRPMLVRDYVFFGENTKKRQNIRPGLSGLAQVNGRNNISWEKKFEYDLKYMQKITFFSDMKIFFLSIWKALKRDNIDREGFSTDEDYGDYLLRTKRISNELYNNKLKDAEKLIENSKYGRSK